MGLAIMWPFQHATIKTKVVVRPRTLLQALQTAIQKHGISNVVATYSSKIVMAALWNRAGHYIFVMWFLSSFFFYSSPNLNGRRFDVYHTSTHGVALVQI